MQTLNYKFQNIELTPRELLDHLLEGHAVCTAELKENTDKYCHRANENFVSTQIVGVDIDNQKNVVNDITGKSEKQCITKEEGYLSYTDVINDPFIRENASFVYCTPSHTEEWHRFRVFFVLKNKISDMLIQKKLNQILTSYFNGDKATTTNCQAFYGCENATHKFFGNILGEETVKDLLNDYEVHFGGKHSKEIKEFENSALSKDQLQEIVNAVFKTGKVSNDRWWKIPTILKNSGLLSDQEIIDMIEKAVGDTNDIENKLKYAEKYKNSMSLGTLIFYAKENGYELPFEIASKSKNIKFWHIKKNEVSGDVSATISYSLLNNFLINNGFRQIEHDKGSQIIKIDANNHIEEVSETKFREFVFDFVCNNNEAFDSRKERFAVEEQLRRTSTTLFNSVKSNLPLFNDKIDEFVTDTEDLSYIFYKNGFLKIETDSIKFNDYSKLGGYIWKKSVLPRQFKQPDSKTSEYQVFIEKVCSTRKSNGTVEFNDKKYDSMRSAIGYLLNKNKNRALVKAIVLCDEAISNSPNGGTGKSIFAHALGEIRNPTIIDGRFFDENSPFRFETVTEATEIINIDDCSPKFLFEKLFHVITGDLTVERKGISRFTIPFERSPKICFSTNHTFHGDGNSHERRIFEIEFSNYFNPNHTPQDEFKHLLFEDWNDNEYNRFYGFMSECVQFYLRNKLVKYNTVNLEEKKLIENTSPELAEYLNQYINTDTIYRTDSVLSDFNSVQNTNITQTNLTRAINYWGNSYKKLTVLSEFDKTLKTKIFVVSTSQSMSIRDWKKSDKYKAMKNGLTTAPSDINEMKYNELMS